MMAQPQSPLFCMRCLHIHSEKDKVCFVNLKTGGKDCICDSQSFLPESGAIYKDERYHLKTVQAFKDITHRVEYTITAIEGARDLNTEDFKWLCWHYWIGFKEGDILTREVKSKIKSHAESDTIRRTRQKLCHPELEKLREFQERMKGERIGTDSYWKITEEIKQFWKNSKYIPQDIEYLRAKGIKESAIFEYSIMELNDIC